MAGSMHVSRRKFLGGSAVALGGLGSGLFGTPLAAQPKAPPLSLPLGALKPTGALDEAYWWKVRSQFNVVDGLTFMNNGTYGPTPRVVVDAFARLNNALAEDPTNNYWNEGRDQVRARMAAFVGATADEIALTRSTSEGMNIFIRGFDWKPGDEVVYCTHEHGGGIQPLLQVEARYGVKLVKIEVPSPPESVDQIVTIYERAMTPRTKMIMVSHMTYVTGLDHADQGAVGPGPQQGRAHLGGRRPSAGHARSRSEERPASTTTPPRGRSGCWPAPAPACAT